MNDSLALPDPCPLAVAQVVACLRAAGELRWDNVAQFPTVTERCGTLCVDSQHIRPGDIFLALRGMTHDGNTFLAQAVSGGACLLISDQADIADEAKKFSVPLLVVGNARRSWALLCAAAHGNPQQHLNIIGITGTNGKTTTATMLAQLLTQTKHKTVLIGSNGIFYAEQLLCSNPLTTPDPDLLYKILAWSQAQGMRYVVLEVSSHAIALHKVAALHCQAVIFTSFSDDHGDFHPTRQDYFTTKWNFIRANSNYAQLLIISQQVMAQALRYGLSITHPQLWLYDYAQAKPPPTHTPTHQRMQVNLLKSHNLTAELAVVMNGQQRLGQLNFFAPHLVLNFAAALLAAENLLSTKIATASWKKIKISAGRMEIISKKPLVIVDYAHTPDALRAALEALSFATPRWVVFGCGGNRDRSKRATMGAVAAQLADHIVLTADNPRDEDVTAITAEILQGVTDHSKVTVQHDRRAAITYAVKEARHHENSAVLIAGKGAEKHQEIEGKLLPFDDRAVCREVLQDALP